MSIKFLPKFIITTQLIADLMRIETAKNEVKGLPLTPKTLASLRDSARLRSTHYSTQIEGNLLQQNQVEMVLKHDGHFPGRERDEDEIRGYYAALRYVEEIVAVGAPITEETIKKLHALVMATGKEKVSPTPYRDGQNVIRDGRTGAIVYLPPEAKDVPELMCAMVVWMQTAKEMPCPLVAGIVHYQFATIHPYYDGNGRTARLLTMLTLYLGGYDLKGIYSLEEYYARDLQAYYHALSIGESHNYYMGRAEADITSWLEYFVHGMAFSCERVVMHMMQDKEQNYPDQGDLMRHLDFRQRKALVLFQDFASVSSRQIGELFGLKPGSSTKLCQDWVSAGFLEIDNPSNKARTYKLAPAFERLAVFKKNR